MSAELDDQNLRKLIKMFKGKTPIGRVGILGSRNARGGETGETNAEIGAKHEFGDSTTPIRSFLRVPLTDKLNEYLKNAGALDKGALKESIKAGTFYPYVQKMAITAESVVLDGFNSEGFGKWKKSNMALKKNPQTLVETGQLRNSITSEVVEGE